MNANTKMTLIDLAHMIHQAILTDDEAIAQQALGDVADALASIIPEEGRACRSATSATQDYSRFLTVAPGVTLVRFAGKDTVTLMAKRPANNSGLAPTIFKVFVDKVSKIGSVYCDDKTLFQVVGLACQSATQLERVCIGALHRILHDRRARTLRAYRQRKDRKNSATQVNG